MTASAKQMAKLESALAGAIRAGDQQSDELVRLSNLTVRQKRTLWRAFCLLKQGRYDDAAMALEAECPELRDRGPARMPEQWWQRKRDLDDPGGAA